MEQLTNETIMDMAVERQGRHNDMVKASAEEENHEFDLAFASSHIKAWKQWYFKKNSKLPAAIYIRATGRFIDGILYLKYVLQLFVKNELKENYNHLMSYLNM